MSRKNFLWAIATISAFFFGTLFGNGGPQRAAAMQASASASAQMKSPKYVEVDYMKAEPGKDSDYVHMEQDVWKQLHQERIKNGQIKSWALYGLRFPAGAEERYDYVTINTYDRFAQLESPFAGVGPMLTKLRPNMKLEDLVRQTQNARKVVRVDVFELIDEANSRESAAQFAARLRVARVERVRRNAASRNPG